MLRCDTFSLIFRADQSFRGLLSGFIEHTFTFIIRFHGEKVALARYDDQGFLKVWWIARRKWKSSLTLKIARVII